MKKRSKNLFSVFGAISLLSGLMLSIPSYLNSNYLGFVISFIFVILGAILLSVAFGD